MSSPIFLAARKVSIAYSSAPTGLVAFALMRWVLRIDDKNA